MCSLYKFYLKNSRRDLVSKLGHYENVNQVSFIKFINLNFLNLQRKSLVILGLGFLFFLTNKKGILSPFNRSSKKNYNCFLKLKGKFLFAFLERLVQINLASILGFEEGLLKKSFSKTGTFSFQVEDIYTFLELGNDLFKFRKLKDLKIFFNFSQPSLKENILLLNSFGFHFI